MWCVRSTHHIYPLLVWLAPFFSKIINQTVNLVDVYSEPLVGSEKEAPCLRAN
jgi:hypothetical protein